MGKTENPSWSRDGSVVAYGFPDGVHVMTRDCQDRLLAPGGSEPAFGPADVTPPQAGGTAAKISRVSLHPRAFRARRGTTVRFRLSAPARVKLSVRGNARSVNGHAGANAVRFKPRLRPGAYTLRLSARGTHAGARFTIRR